MPEPITIISGVAAIVGNVWKMSSDLYKLIEDIKNAPRVLRGILDDLRGLRNVLAALQGLLPDVNADQLRPDLVPVFESLNINLENCYQVLAQVFTKLSRYTNAAGEISMGKWAAFRWQFKEKNINELRRHISAYKMTVNLALAAANFANASQTLLANARIEAEIKDMHELLDKLDVDKNEDEDESLVADNGSCLSQVTDRGYALRKFLVTTESAVSGSPSTSPRLPTIEEVTPSMSDLSLYHEESGTSHLPAKKEDIRYLWNGLDRHSLGIMDPYDGDHSNNYPSPSRDYQMPSPDPQFRTNRPSKQPTNIESSVAQVDDSGMKRPDNFSGISSPQFLVDGSTSKPNSDRILEFPTMLPPQFSPSGSSADIIALMDHLALRDAQRSARDTEVLTELIRAAVEMRKTFEDLKPVLDASQSSQTGTTTSSDVVEKRKVENNSNGSGSSFNHALGSTSRDVKENNIPRKSRWSEAVLGKKASIDNTSPISPLKTPDLTSPASMFDARRSGRSTERHQSFDPQKEDTRLNPDLLNSKSKMEHETKDSKQYIHPGSNEKLPLFPTKSPSTSREDNTFSRDEGTQFIEKTSSPSEEGNPTTVRTKPRRKPDPDRAKLLIEYFEGGPSSRVANATSLPKPTTPARAPNIGRVTNEPEDDEAFRSNSSSRASVTSINNPKLAKAVDDAINRLILPELKAAKEAERQRKVDQASFDSRKEGGSVRVKTENPGESLSRKREARDHRDKESETIRAKGRRKSKSRSSSLAAAGVAAEARRSSRGTTRIQRISEDDVPIPSRRNITKSDTPQVDHISPNVDVNSSVDEASTKNTPVGGIKPTDSVASGLTSYTIPDDGTPVVIRTNRVRNTKGNIGRSQTSLLLEYFEQGERKKPSVRVRVTPTKKSNKESSSTPGEAVVVTMKEDEADLERSTRLADDYEKRVLE